MKTRRKMAGYETPAIERETFLALEDCLLAWSVIHYMDEISIEGQQIQEYDAAEDFDNSWY